MTISKAESQLMKRLKSIWDNKNFVCGVMSGLRQAGKVESMLEFLKMAERREEKYTPDQILSLTVAMRKKE